MRCCDKGGESRPAVRVWNGGVFGRNVAEDTTLYSVKETIKEEKT